MKSTIITAATNVIGYKTKQVAKKPWTTEDMLEKMDERLKWKHQTTIEAQTQYRKLNNELRRITEKHEKHGGRNSVMSWKKCRDKAVMTKSTKK